MAITADKALRGALQSRSHILGPAFSWQGGTDPTAFTEALFYVSMIDKRKTRKASRRMSEHQEAYEAFIADIGTPSDPHGSV